MTQLICERCKGVCNETMRGKCIGCTYEVGDRAHFRAVSLEAQLRAASRKMAKTIGEASKLQAKVDSLARAGQVIDCYEHTKALCGVSDVISTASEALALIHHALRYEYDQWRS